MSAIAARSATDSSATSAQSVDAPDADRHVVARQLPDGASESIGELAFPGQPQFFSVGGAADLGLAPGEVGADEQDHAAKALKQGCPNVRPKPVPIRLG